MFESIQEIVTVVFPCDRFRLEPIISAKVLNLEIPRNFLDDKGMLLVELDSSQLNANKRLSRVDSFTPINRYSAKIQLVLPAPVESLVN